MRSLSRALARTTAAFVLALVTMTAAAPAASAGPICITFQDDILYCIEP